MIYQESGLEFDFDESWYVQVYDKHRFYQGLSGEGLSGMDFIGLRDGQLYLFEVKNYRRRQNWQTDNPFDNVVARPESLAEAISKKVADTLLGIDAIGQYYHRKPLFRWLEPWLLNRIPPSREWAFWARAYLLAAKMERLTIILWLETEHPQEELRQLLKELLGLKNPGAIRILGREKNGLPGLSVSRLLVD